MDTVKRFHPIRDRRQEPVRRCLSPTDDLRRVAVFPLVRGELVLVQKLDGTVRPGLPDVDVQINHADLGRIGPGGWRGDVQYTSHSAGMAQYSAVHQACRGMSMTRASALV
jgi:hypothetical protein